MVSQLTCCGITFGWFDELVVHCQEVHAVQAAPARSPSLEATASQRANSEDWGEGDLDEEDLDEENSEDCQYDEEEDADEQSDLEVDTLHATQHSPAKNAKQATSGAFHCHIRKCGRSFATLTGVNSHISHTHPNATRDFKCTARYPKPCQEAFYNKYSLENHVNKFHKNTYVRKCANWGFEDCEASFKTLSEIKDHLKEEHDQFVCRSAKNTSCKFAAESQAALVDHYEFTHKERAPERDDGTSVAQIDISRFNVDRHGGFQSLAGRAGIQTKSQDRRSKRKGMGLQGTPRFPKGYQHHDLSEGVVGRRREDDVDRSLAYRMGYTISVNNSGADVRGNQIPVNRGSGHQNDTPKTLLNRELDYAEERTDQSDETEASDNDDSDGFDEGLAQHFVKAGKATRGLDKPRILGSRAYANANLFKHTQIQPTRRPGHGHNFSPSSQGSTAPSTEVTPKARQNNIYTRHSDVDFIEEATRTEASPCVVSEDQSRTGDDKPIKKRAVQRLTLTNAEEDMLRYTGYFPHRQRYAKAYDISIAERERFELGKWTAHRNFEVRMEFHSHPDLIATQHLFDTYGGDHMFERVAKFSDIPDIGARHSGSNRVRAGSSIRKLIVNEKTPTKVKKKKTARAGATPKRSYGRRLGDTKPVEERKTMLNKRKKNVISAERIVNSDDEDVAVKEVKERSDENGEQTVEKSAGGIETSTGSDEVLDTNLVSGHRAMASGVGSTPSDSASLEMCNEELEDFQKVFI